ncbi:MAG: hypothetical protein ACK4VZ_01450 [Paracoccaceae bacterium]
MGKIDFERIVTAQAVEAAHLARTRDDAAAVVATAIEAAMTRCSDTVPIAEMLAWGAKELAARAVVADPEAEPDAILMVEAEMTGESVADLAARIIINAKDHRSLVSLLTGVRRKALAAIAAAADAEAIAGVLKDAIDRIAAAQGAAQCKEPPGQRS